MLWLHVTTYSALTGYILKCKLLPMKPRKPRRPHQTPQRLALQTAVEVVGSQSELARRISSITKIRVKQGVVWAWLNLRRVPAEFVIPIERATSGIVGRSALRPDLYPPKEPAGRRKACD
ncbi:MAG: YdaS family helix-turn-helix protein [Acidiferrobacteraceae bacterium]